MIAPDKLYEEEENKFYKKNRNDTMVISNGSIFHMGKSEWI